MENRPQSVLPPPTELTDLLKCEDHPLPKFPDDLVPATTDELLKCEDYPLPPSPDPLPIKPASDVDSTTTDELLKCEDYPLPSSSDPLPIKPASDVDPTKTDDLLKCEDYPLNGSPTAITTAPELRSGSKRNDWLSGGSDSDWLSGGLGNDTLTGGEGRDRFLFEARRTMSSSKLGIDKIVDFDAAIDTIGLDKTIFSALRSRVGTGFSRSKEFASVSTNAAAATSKALIVYNQSNGCLFYNENGVAAGLGEGSQFAKLIGAPTLAASNFIIQA